MEASLIGRETRVSAPITVAAAAAGRVSLELRTHAIPLPAIRVEAGARCRVRRPTRPGSSGSGDEAHKAIAAQAGAEGAGLHELEISAYERDLDAAGRKVEREGSRETRGHSDAVGEPSAS